MKNFNDNKGLIFRYKLVLNRLQPGWRRCVAFQRGARALLPLVATMAVATKGATAIVLAPPWRHRGLWPASRLEIEVNGKADLHHTFTRVGRCMNGCLAGACAMNKTSENFSCLSALPQSPVISYTVEAKTYKQETRNSEPISMTLHPYGCIDVSVWRSNQSS